MEEKQEPKFNKIWRRLDRALHMPCFGPYESSILQVGRELSYTSSVIDGDRRARPFKINARRLVAARGLKSRTQVYTVIKNLLDGNVLTGTISRLRINTRYHSWTGRYALSPEQIEECDSADTRPVTLCGSYGVSRKKANGNPSASACAPTKTEVSSHEDINDLLCSHEDILSSHEDNVCLPTKTFCLPTKTTHIEERGEEEESIRRESRVILSLPTLSHESQRERERFSAEPDETDTFTPAVYHPSIEEPFAGIEAEPPPPVVLTPEQSRLKASVESAARKATRRDGYPDGFDDAAEAMADWALDELAAGAKASAIKDSVSKACRKIADGMDWGSGPSYAAKCLQSWKADPSVKASVGDAWKPPLPTTNGPNPEQAEADRLARREAEAKADARRSRWEALDAREKAALAKEWESTHPAPKGLPARFLEAHKRAWCEETAEQRGLAR